MSQPRWKEKARALAALAEDQRGNPEGDLAREKLLKIIRDHPEAANYEPVRTLVTRDIRLSDLKKFDTSGSWMGANLADALRLMLQEYRRRLTEAEGRKRLGGST